MTTKTKRRRKLSEKEQFFAARGVPPEAVEVPAPPTAEQRITDLEKRLDHLCQAQEHTNKALVALVDAIEKANKEREERVKAWADTVTEDLRRLFANDQLLGRAIETHFHLGALGAYFLR